MPLKLIHFISSLSRGGRERQLYYIYKYNDPKKQEIKILYLDETQPNYIDDFTIKEKDLIKVKAKSTFRRICEIYKIYRKQKPDVVFAWGGLESLFSLLLKPLTDYNFVNGSVRHGITSPKLSHYWRMLFLHCSKHIVANSYAGLKVNHLKRGDVLYNGIDEKFFNIKATSPVVLDLKCKIKSPVLISVANLVPYKDYFTVLDALAVIKKKGYDYSYLVIGDGPLKNEVNLKIKNFGLSEQVMLLGSKNNVEEYLSIADIFIHSSKGEGCSNSILEAMAAGLPIIATNVGGIPEIVDKTYGILFDYKNKEELIYAIELLLNDMEKAREMGKLAKEKAHRLYSINSMLQRYYDITETIMRK